MLLKYSSATDKCRQSGIASLTSLFQLSSYDPRNTVKPWMIILMVLFNPSPTEYRLHWQNEANYVAVDALAPFIARWSAWAWTHLPLDKMAAIFADDNFKCIFLNENHRILNQISLKFVPKGSIYNIPALVQIMAWRQIGDKSFSEPMLTRFTGAYMRH